MSTVSVYEALFWHGDSPLGTSGEVDFEALAHGLALTEHRIEARGRFSPHEAISSGDRSAPRQRLAERKHYTRAQHAVVVSEAVDSVAGLETGARRVLATHVCLAAARDELLEPGNETSERTKTKWNTMDLAAFADGMAHTNRWEGGEGPVPGAAAVDGLLVRLGGLGGDDRRTLALHALLSETVPAGLGTAVAEAVLARAGLDPRVPSFWVWILRLIRRMADAAVRRDLPGAGPVGESSFPALKRRIAPMDPAAAARLWLARYEALRAPERKGER